MVIYFATNRNEVKASGHSSFGTKFDPLRPDLLSFGCIPDETAANKLTTDCIVDTSEEVSKLLTQIQAEMRDGCQDAIIYIHGFRNTFEAGVDAARQMSKILNKRKLKTQMCLLSWPADCTALPTLDYRSDRMDARLSGPAVGRAFQMILDFLAKAAQEDQRCMQNLHLICHSMGNYVMRQAFQKMQNDYGVDHLPLLFKEIIMVAPDEDSDAFEDDRKLKYLDRICRRVTIYHNSGDLAMKISDKTKFNPDRLGDVGPRNTQLLSSKISVVDCSDVITSQAAKANKASFLDRLSEHGYHLLIDKVQDDIANTLKGERPDRIANRIVELSKGKGFFALT